MAEKRNIVDERELRKEFRATFSALRQVDRETAKETRRRFRELAKPVAMDARRRAPKDTGKMAKTIRPRVDSRGDAGIASNHPAVRPWHFGGRHPLFGNRKHWYPMPRKPFMFEAVDAHRAKFFAEAETAIEEAGKKAGFK